MGGDALTMATIALAVMLALMGCFVTETSAASFVLGDTSVTYRVDGRVFHEKLTDTLYAKFSPSNPIVGEVVVFAPEKSCKLPTTPPPPPSRPKLMLADRTSNCSFTQQAYVARAYGMAGMIISDVHSQRGSVILMTTEDKALSFPSVSCTPDVSARLNLLSNDVNIRSLNVTIEPYETIDFAALTFYTRTAIFIVLCIVFVFMSSVYCQHGLRRLFCQRRIDRRVVVEQGRFNDRATQALQHMETRTYHRR
ncbi:hypothetical protein PTSG_03164 [Salpingoeca rosetta]|uniref:PA domain-containing protein n=1 Tax=Salpingoeca rosetta (strain ATCC 50818 / BSB-021) TaxID=946362 RepID=F2U4E8_SALR5|nr:uncharacterized protein PTSG_03164 [Salpingoeca rosetta]EGD82514.1 hypothetical protein PTSG_03164 [Salpingoeca rosetta]|eukprot:XP_004995750.1 hypothetical protein PTSG_03164 [Salpingoeca rosetta]